MVRKILRTMLLTGVQKEGGYLLTAREILKKLTEWGCSTEEGAKHTKVIAPDGKYTFVPRHAKDIPIGTLVSIEKQIGIKLR